MKYLLLLTVAIQIASNANGLPLPAGQIVKYRVPSKYFSQQNETAQESSSSLYSFLSQIHYGESSPSVTINTDEIQSEDVSESNDAATEQTENETSTSKDPEASDNVTDQQTDQINVVKVDDDSLKSLIEKVVNEKLQKLANEKSGTIAVEVIQHDSEPLSVVGSSQEAETTTSSDESTMEAEQSDLSDTTESSNLDSETILPTITPTAEKKLDEITEEVDTTTNDPQSNSNEEDNGDHVSDSLLSAVGDLLSSILGLDSTIDDNSTESVDSNNDEVTTESQLFASTDEIEGGMDNADEETTTAGGLKSEESEESGATEDSNANQDKPTSEVDAKIENLAIAQTSFATENIPEQVTMTVSDETAPDVLEAISMSTDEKPDSIEERINQVMNLVKGTEGRLALEAMESALDSTLIDKEMKNDVNDLAQIVYGTLREAESSFGLNEEDKTELVNSPAVHEELIKNFEMGISDAVVDKNQFDHENFLPNSAKAALHYNHQDFNYY